MPEAISSDRPVHAVPPAVPAHVISSAVVTVMPDRAAAVEARLRAMPDTEICAVQGSKIVIVLEAERRGAVGERLAQIALLEGVISANMVFEHTEEESA